MGRDDQPWDRLGEPARVEPGPAQPDLPETVRILKKILRFIEARKDAQACC